MNDEQELNQALKLARENAPDTGRLEFGLEARVLGRIRDRRAIMESGPLMGWLGLQIVGVCSLILVGLLFDYEIQTQQLADYSFRILSGEPNSTWLF